MLSPEQLRTLAGQASAVLKSLREFDKLEILPVVKSLLSPTDRDRCFVGIYYRAAANVRTLLALNNAYHFQAIAMISRATIEIAMDMKLLNIIPRSVEKMMAFVPSEKLKTAKKIVAFAQGKAGNPPDVNTYEQFIAANEASVIGTRTQLWGRSQPPEHWSNMNIKERAVQIGAPFDELYEIKYRHLSWQAHAGLTGVAGLESGVFTAMCGDAFGIAATCYEEVLGAMIVELQLSKVDPKIWKKLTLARLLPATDGPDQVAQLQRDLLD